MWWTHKNKGCILNSTHQLHPWDSTWRCQQSVDWHGFFICIDPVRCPYFSGAKTPTQLSKTKLYSKCSKKRSKVHWNSPVPPWSTCRSPAAKAKSSRAALGDGIRDVRIDWDLPMGPCLGDPKTSWFYIAGKWMFIPLKMVLIRIDPYPYNYIDETLQHILIYSSNVGTCYGDGCGGVRQDAFSFSN